MPLRHTIGISLAFLMISAGANAKDREESHLHHHHTIHHHHTLLHHHGRLHTARHERTKSAGERPRAAAHGQQRHRTARHARLSHHHHSLAAAGRRRDEPLDAYWGPVHAVRRAEIGRAAWYRLIGGRTASGERLDTTTPTAAHRTLPLNSLAKVTDLDNGRSIIVKINDRGPVSRNLLIDLSPRAARLLHMKHAGIADVMIQPLARGQEPQRRPTALAAYYDTPDQ